LGAPSKNVFLLIPVENQVRELDPKLLLACIAARRGVPAVIGSRREIEFHMSSFPRSIYLSKGLKSGNGRFFRILRQLGHQVVAWDEEAFVHLPADTYYSRRLSPLAMQHVTHLFAWGENNARLWRQYPHLPSKTPIHVTGNPRGDLLRSEMQPFYKLEAEKIRDLYGDFILVNTNFNHVNAFSPFQNLFQPVKTAQGEMKFGEAAKGMSRAYAEGLRDHKQAVFEDFQRLIPFLDLAFADYTIVVRPHPTENQNVYHQLAARCQRVKVTNEGNVVPWLMVTRALVHNGCTTGVEAFLMGVPAISYRATINEEYDDGFYRLPNRLSHQCFNQEELQEMLQRVLIGQLGPAAGDERQALMADHIAAQDGALACERIMDVIEEMIGDRLELPQTAFKERLVGWVKLTRRTWKKRLKAHLPHSINKPEFQQHRYPGVPLADFQKRLKRYQELLGDRSELKVALISDHFFKISAF
jgi:surface carbohydrate biosynthesis protein